MRNSFIYWKSKKKINVSRSSTNTCIRSSTNTCIELTWQIFSLLGIQQFDFLRDKLSVIDLHSPRGNKDKLSVIDLHFRTGGVLETSSLLRFPSSFSFPYFIGHTQSWSHGRHGGLRKRTRIGVMVVLRDDDLSYRRIDQVDDRQLWRLHRLS